MQFLLTADQMRRAEEQAIRQHGQTEQSLMERAATALVRALQDHFGTKLSSTKGLILAGPGKNGGDGRVAGRMLQQEGVRDFKVIAVAEQQFTPQALDGCDWVIDAMLGTGLSRPVDGKFLSAIQTLNAHEPHPWVLSADIPSGLDADTGNARPQAVHASQTVTFGFIKRGLVTGEAARFVGELKLAEIDIPRSLGSSHVYLFDPVSIKLPPRRPDSHKGDHGRVAILAGPPDREGAAALSALGALKAGAGLVTVLADEPTLTSLRPRLVPEAMSARFTGSFDSVVHSVLVVGPGLGTDAQALTVLKAALAHHGPLVLDADALTLLSQDSGCVVRVAERNAPTVLTPHPKEAARLLGCTTEEVQADRFAAVSSLAQKFVCQIALKGSGTLCASPDNRTIVVRAGDAGLAKGGTGDVLSGVVASLLAQGMEPSWAVAASVYLHGKASEWLTRQQGQSRSTLASEVAQAITHVLSEWECHPKSSIL